MLSMLRGVMVGAFLLASGCALNLLGVQFTADIGDESFKAVVGWWEDTELGGIPTGHIVASDSTGNLFDITVAGVFEERTYALGLSGMDRFEAFATYSVFSEGAIYLSESGTLTVTSKTPERLTGIFEMTLAVPGSEEVLKVTNGVFDLPVAPAPEV